MKFPAFDYESPTSLSEAVALLADHGDEAMLLAGGQSLMPILAFRMAAPALLVDLKNVPALDRIDIGADGITLGASVRWRDIERHTGLSAAHPLLWQKRFEVERNDQEPVMVAPPLQASLTFNDCKWSRSLCVFQLCVFCRS